jgi:VIT1/CCC1 family predicted Fe2+/Mn2+ transporter
MAKGLYIRNIVFGIADSLVSTVGLLSGISASGATRSIIILTGVIYAFVEAFSMAVGSFLSEESVEEYATKSEISDSGPFVAGTLMFVSFVIASTIPIFPYVIFGRTLAIFLSIVFSITFLFILGVVSAKISNIRLLKSGLKMALLGGAAIIIGIIVGKFIK